MSEIPPIWKWPPYFSQMLDPYVQGSELEGSGKIEYTLSLLIKELLNLPRDNLSILTNEQFSEISNVVEMMKPIGTVLGTIKDIKDGSGLATYVEAWGNLVDLMGIGEFLFLPAGWTDGIRSDCHVTFLLHRISENDLRVVICNKGQGLEYHPRTVQYAPKIKYQVYRDIL